MSIVEKKCIDIKEILLSRYRFIYFITYLTYNLRYTLDKIELDIKYLFFRICLQKFVRHLKNIYE